MTLPVPMGTKFSPKAALNRAMDLPRMSLPGSRGNGADENGGERAYMALKEGSMLKRTESSSLSSLNRSFT